MPAEVDLEMLVKQRFRENLGERVEGVSQRIIVVVGGNLNGHARQTD